MFVKDLYLRRNPPYLTDMLCMTDYANSSPAPHNLAFNLSLYNKAVALSVSPKLLRRVTCFHTFLSERENHKLDSVKSFMNYKRRIP
jgi:hypothetical protein